jgi:cyanophycinase-like exopeptidase
VDLGRVGSATPKPSTPTPGLVLMGGGVDVDEAMRWLIARSGGGDLVVLRSTGGAGYNAYLYGLGGLNSVQTLLVDSVAEGNDECVAQTIRNAGALFIAGGNQADYVRYFKGAAVGAAINHLIATRRAPVGGTSAGMAILGQHYHPGGAPEHNSGLLDPSRTEIGQNFVTAPWLRHTVTEPHFTAGTTGAVGTVDNPKRAGRVTAFLAQMLLGQGVAWPEARAIAVDNDTAVAIADNGVAQVFSQPGRSGQALFVRPTAAPERLVAGSPLTWNAAGQALAVDEVPGTANGAHTFDLGAWRASGGTARQWSVVDGVLTRR